MKMFLKILNDKYGSSICFEEYVKFCLDNKYDGEEYSELHHILPRSQFPEFEKSEWNIIRLQYLNHITAHEILANTLPIRSFIEPLKFMLQYDDKSKEFLSKLRKKEWELFKKSNQYNIWLEKRIAFAKEAYTKGGIYYDHMIYMSKLGNTEENKHKKSMKLKEFWNDDDKKEKKSKQMKEFYENNEEIKELLREKSNSFWTSEEAIIIKEKLSNNNKKEENRLKNSEGLKKAWTDPVKRENFIKNRVGKVWWNNGVNETKAEIAPGPEWTRGRTLKYTKEMVEKRNVTNRKKHEN